jgi:methanogenic corrinoid protein MtbC1
MAQPLLTRYLQPLLSGRRTECFELIREALADGIPARTLIDEVIWPALSQIERLYQDDRINIALEHMASRINRTVADQLQAHLPESAKQGRRIVIACAEAFREEIGAQMVADLFQSDGWEVFFVGGGVPDDELLALVGQHRPSALLLFGADPQQVPAIRRLVETVREIGVCPTMNIVVSGGLFNRAEGLWEEVGVDAFAATANEVLDLINNLPQRIPGPPRRGSVKKRQRRRRSAEAEVTKSISKAELAMAAQQQGVGKIKGPAVTVSPN